MPGTLTICPGVPRRLARILRSAAGNGSRSMHRAKGGAPALTAFALETGLTHRYGFTWNNAFRARGGD
jgi:hypothetical protein